MLCVGIKQGEVKDNEDYVCFKCRHVTDPGDVFSLNKVKQEPVDDPTDYGSNFARGAQTDDKSRDITLRVVRCHDDDEKPSAEDLEKALNDTLAPSIDQVDECAMVTVDAAVELTEAASVTPVCESNDHVDTSKLDIETTEVVEETIVETTMEENEAEMTSPEMAPIEVTSSEITPQDMSAVSSTKTPEDVTSSAVSSSVSNEVGADGD